MARVAVMADEETWTVGWGLGLGLYRRGDRVYAGHGGAMPGFLASLVVCRLDGTGAVVLTNSGAGPKVEKLALDLAEATDRALPVPDDAWVPDAGAPDEVRPLLGTWWTEGSELLLTWRSGRLRAELLAGSPGTGTRPSSPKVPTAGAASRGASGASSSASSATTRASR